MRIIDLAEGDEDDRRQTAELLHVAFRENGPDAWPTVTDARQEVGEALVPDRISRIAIAEDGRVVGFIAGIRQYDGAVWELHPLAVLPERQGQGIGRSLVEDLERLVGERGGLTIWVGTDDEQNLTTLGGKDLYPDVLGKLVNARGLGRHPIEFYRRLGYEIVGVIPDANGFGKPDILMAKRVGGGATGDPQRT